VSRAPRVSVIIPAYGRTDLLEKAVRSALAQDLDPDDFEVIVVDSSPDGANADLVLHLAGSAACDVRCLRKEPEGPGPSRNLGAEHARGGVLAFLDSDCRASPGWLRCGLSAFEDRVGIVQGRTVPEPGGRHSVFHRSLEVQAESCFYETANVLYRRRAFEESGGFLADPRGESSAGLVGGEDADLAWKVKRAGWETRFAEDALVAHAVFSIPVWRWFFDRRLGTVPLVVARYPETRKRFYARYFLNRTQALLVLGLVGLALSLAHPLGLLLVVPYVYDRIAEPSRTLKGPFRLVRVVLHLPRDLAMLAVLIIGSVRYRALLL
jgi:cellulose synthase/poly-beta-1,6-N-acetylglucosamine synthase-like glycosyltransferase